MKGGRVIRPFVAHRVTESQSHTTSTPYTGGWNFFMPIFYKLPYSLRSQGDYITFGLLYFLFCFVVLGLKLKNRRITILEKKVGQLLLENSDLKRFKRRALSKKFSKQIATKILENWFTSTQTKMLVEGQKRARKWNSDDIINGLLLRCFSMKAYKFLREKKLLPLPAPSTLQLWVKDFHCYPGMCMLWTSLWSSINDITQVGGGGVLSFVTLCMKT